MNTTEIYIPEELDNTILQFTTNKQLFVMEAIKDRIEKLKNQELKKLLVEGYKYSAKEDRELMEDFTHIDLENWDEY
ncbi:MAG: hypothetical protein DRJ05_00135 [Bacteroidetes bacterium]|nr:MAG: hypothetical protein DRJ05_00135 [Bacteroidota bacterium]